MGGWIGPDASGARPAKILKSNLNNLDFPAPTS